MITKVSHVTFFVLDQDKAYDFYVNKLGFKVNTDAKMENGFRWLTLTPPEQPDLEIALLNPLSGMTKFDEETTNAFRVLLEKGALGAGVLHTPDCRDLRQSFVPRFSSVVPFAFARVPMKS
jgi:catechol 2,3-dioxygenase-like lactoylglutathione lyase family enzyme